LSDTHEPVVSELIDLLTLERLEDNLFRGQSRDIGTKYVFGGQVLGQALSAAQATVDNGRHVHSLHAYFLRAGNIDHPIVYDVDRTRDGGSFSVRRVTAIQHGKVIFFCAASFQQAEQGADHEHHQHDDDQRHILHHVIGIELHGDGIGVLQREHQYRHEHEQSQGPDKVAHDACS